MRFKILTAVALMLLLNACKKDKSTISDLTKDGKPITTSTSFYPMQIGNYWKNDDQDYTIVQDTLRIEGSLYYKFYSLIGGDAVSVRYLRVDENQNLLEAIPSDTSFHSLRAKFNASINDTFHTLNNQNFNDYFGRVTYKSATKISFQFNSTAPNANSTIFVTTYYKGIGPDDVYTSIKINGIVYNYKSH